MTTGATTPSAVPGDPGAPVSVSGPHFRFRVPRRDPTRGPESYGWTTSKSRVDPSILSLLSRPTWPSVWGIGVPCSGSLAVRPWGKRYTHLTPSLVCVGDRSTRLRPEPGSGHLRFGVEREGSVGVFRDLGPVWVARGESVQGVRHPNRVGRRGSRRTRSQGVTKVGVPHISLPKFWVHLES